MSMVTNTLGRYFAGRFVVAAVGVFAGIFVLLVLVDYIEMVRKTSGLVAASAITVAETSLFRVPQLLEKLMPFCVLIGAMTCYLALSRRLELVGRAPPASRPGSSSRRRWQARSCSASSPTIAYNPMSANLRELSKRMEAELFGSAPGGGIQDASGFWLNQINSDGQAIINAARSEQQGVRLTGLTVFRFDTAAAVQGANRSARSGARRRPLGVQAAYADTPSTSLRSTRTTSTSDHPDPGPGVATVSPPRKLCPFGNFRATSARRRARASRPQATGCSITSFIAQPFLLAAMVMLAASVSLRFFRMGGVQKMVLSGVGAGFLLYVLSKVTEDLSKAELMHPIAAAWLPVCVGGLTGFLALLYQEDG